LIFSDATMAMMTGTSELAWQA